MGDDSSAGCDSSRHDDETVCSAAGAKTRWDFDAAEVSYDDGMSGIAEAMSMTSRPALGASASTGMTNAYYGATVDKSRRW